MAAEVVKSKFHFTSEKEDEETPSDTKFEKVLKKAGLFGRYQIYCCLVIQYASIQWAGERGVLSISRVQNTGRAAILLF